MVAFFLNAEHYFDASITQDVILYSISKQQLEAMSEQQPQLAIVHYRKVPTTDASIIDDIVFSSEFMS